MHRTRSLWAGLLLIGVGILRASPPLRRPTLVRFDFFLTAADPALGYSADGCRLVQRWCLDDITYPTGSLFNPETGEMTAVGEEWRGWVAGR